MKVLASGTGEFRGPAPDGRRAYVGEHKGRRPVNKVMTERDAVQRFVQDGDYVAYDQNVANRGPSSLFREIIRQHKKDLWLCAKFNWSDVSLLTAGGCVSKVDVGWLESVPAGQRAVKKGEIKLIEWTNGALSYRLLAGAMGVPFLPMRYLGGTDAFACSAAKLIEDPYLEKPICVVPALNPDVGIVHVHQCDVYGNARVFGAGVAPAGVAPASQKNIISPEEILAHRG